MKRRTGWQPRFLSANKFRGNALRISSPQILYVENINVESAESSSAG